MTYLEFLNDFFKGIELGILEVKLIDDNWFFVKSFAEVPLSHEGGAVNRLMDILPDIYRCLHEGQNMFVHGLDFHLDRSRSSSLCFYIKRSMTEDSGVMRYTSAGSNPLLEIMGEHRQEFFREGISEKWPVYEITYRT